VLYPHTVHIINVYPNTNIPVSDYKQLLWEFNTEEITHFQNGEKMAEE
jgi:hypothetical protein